MATSAEHSKKHYERNREARIQITRDARARLRETLKEIKDNQPCMDCGVKYPHYVLQYDHRDPATKRADVSQIINWGSLKGLLAEIEKCDLVCANCHAVRTWNQNHPE